MRGFLLAALKQIVLLLSRNRETICHATIDWRVLTAFGRRRQRFSFELLATTRSEDCPTAANTRIIFEMAAAYQLFSIASFGTVERSGNLHKGLLIKTGEQPRASAAFPGRLAQYGVPPEHTVRNPASSWEKSIRRQAHEDPIRQWASAGIVPNE